MQTDIEANDVLVQQLIFAVETMPAFPESVRRILILTQDVNCAAKDLIQVIDKDPVFTLRILRIVNSTYYGLANKITSIDHAVVYLGFNTIKNLAVAIAAIGVLPVKNDADFDVQRYLQHCLSTAGIAKRLASKVPGADPAECFIAGLLHDFGKIVLAQFKPNEFRQALQSSQESGHSLHIELRKILGLDHATVGAMLMEHWALPRPLIDTIRYQYAQELMDTDLCACVFAANQISKKLKLGFAGNTCIDEIPATAKSRLGGTLEQLIATLSAENLMFDSSDAAHLL